MIRRLLPHPYLTALLTAVWMVLHNSLSLGAFVVGLILGLLIPVFTAAYWPKRPALKKPLRILEYVGILLWDILVANMVVAATILFKSNANIRSTWVAIPLDIRTPEAITALASTITLTPGTVSADLSSEGSTLLVHCLDAEDPDEVRDQIKQRYERRLKEIFE
ncbi:Na+/H+ antiporter subunit E [Tranquillimonas alkanivorans]|uniref:Multisubunit potassium/proton antiporter, PhaE subunit n=1 Tax=Tranquillimonas alkanivorans TaxID=441119 RepID=A0A1I5Q7Q7_9RHOB|nr:Na+/H+ antiporter subunit E [Tranquillimonas alkanivorans]SFP42398.1 multisubunit potassium/proton antiporter, PhaE subunit [Tranquillimonas alkanivorans]